MTQKATKSNNTTTQHPKHLTNPQPNNLINGSAEMTLRLVLLLAVTAAAGNARIWTKMEELPSERPCRGTSAWDVRRVEDRGRENVINFVG